MGEIISLMMLAGVPILGVISMGYLLRCDEKRRQRMVRTAAVFLGALVLMIGGNFVLSFFGLAWRRTAWAVLLNGLNQQLGGDQSCNGWLFVRRMAWCLFDPAVGDKERGRSFDRCGAYGINGLVHICLCSFRR